MHEDDKRLAAQAAIEEVEAGMLVGLGTGTTAAFAIEILGERVRAGLAIGAVVTSQRSAVLAMQAGIPLLKPGHTPRLHLAIDGTDEIDDRLWAIKGAGGAMLREKIVAASAARMIVIADGSKKVDAIGAAKIPVEILPAGSAYVARVLGDLKAKQRFRTVRRGEWYRTDQGNFIADCQLPKRMDVEAFAEVLNHIPGMLGHGLFLTQVDAAYIAQDGVVTKLERPALPKGSKRRTLDI